MKRLLSFLMVMLLLSGLTLPVSAQTEGPSEVPVVTPIDALEQTPTQPAPEVPEETTTPPTDAPTTEPVPEDPTEKPTQPPEESTAPTLGSESCEHSWIYVEVDPTCIEYGAKGYVCIHCEAITEAEAIDLAPHAYDNSCDPACNVCGAERSVSHKYSSSWSKNSSQHWHACSVCGEKSDVGGHYPGPAATEEKAQYCLTCGLMMMPKKEHTHKYSKTYTSDETEHWYACEGCKDRKSAEPHSYDDLCDPECNICGYTSWKKHDYGSWQSNGDGHWNTCSLCGLSTDPEEHIPTAELTENAPQLCSICGFEIAAASVHVHEASGDWNSDENSHWKLCECSEKMDEELHSWDEGTETEDEVMLYTCTVCDAEKEELIPEEEKGFSWWLPVGTAVLLCAVIALAALIFVKNKSGKY